MKRIALRSRGRSALTTMLVLACSSACTPTGEIVGEVPAPETSPTMLAAMQRDLGESAPEVERRLLAEATAARREPALRVQLGDTYAGAWMSDDGNTLVVGVTDAQLADQVREAGAEPQVVTRSLRQLELVKSSLDRAAADAGAGVHSWHVDVVGNRVVVEAEVVDAPAVQAFAARAATLAGADAVQVIAVTGDRPRPLYDIRGGDEIILNSNTLCSVGFSVDGGGSSKRSTSPLP